jgi:DNA-binding transcriptional LysR family regulator
MRLTMLCVQCMNRSMPMHLTHSLTDLNLLVVLRHLLDTRSVTAAAERLRLSQPATSRALGRLRYSFGDALLVRSGSQLVLTPHAQRLQAQLPAVFAQLDQLLAQEVFEPARAERTFVIATSDYGSAVLMPGLLRRLQAEAPTVTLRLVQVPANPEQHLETGAFDLVWSPQRDLGQSVVWTPLVVERFAFVVRKGHPSLRQPLTVDRFCSISQIALSPEGRPGNPLDDQLARIGGQRRVVAHAPSFTVVPGLVAMSDLGAVLPKRVITASRAFNLVERPLPFEVRGFTMAQAWHERARHDGGHQWLRQLVFAVAKSDKTLQLLGTK